MKKGMALTVLCVLGLVFCSSCAQPTTKEMSLEVLQDKIKGGWAGQTISCTYGGPTEFRFKSKMIPDDHDIPWRDGYLHRNGPGSP